MEALYAGLGRVVEIFRRFDLTLTDEVDKVDFRRTLASVLVGDFERKEVDQLFAPNPNPDPNPNPNPNL